MSHKMILDNRELEFKAGDTVLAVAKRNDIFIPTLCHHDALRPYGACRLCLVEVVKGDRPGLQASCIMKAKAGLEVLTDSELLKRVRKTLIELLLSRFPQIGAVQELASRFSLNTSPYNREEKGQDCILCGRCVRACEAMGRHVIGFSGRGRDRVLFFEEESHPSCLGCQACENLCPTGAIRFSKGARTLINERLKKPIPLARCPVCGRPSFSLALIQEVRERFGHLGPEDEMCPRCKGLHALSKVPL